MRPTSCPELRPSGRERPCLRPKSRRLGKSCAVLLAAVAEIAVWGSAADGDVPVDALHEGADLVGGAAGGVEAADEAAHAGADDEVDGDVMLLEIVDDADVGEAECSSAFKHEGYAGAVLFVFVSRLWSAGGTFAGTAVAGS